MSRDGPAMTSQPFCGWHKGMTSERAWVHLWRYTREITPEVVQLWWHETGDEEKQALYADIRAGRCEVAPAIADLFSRCISLGLWRPCTVARAPESPVRNS